MDSKTLDGILLALRGYGDAVEGTRFMDDNHQLMNGHRWITIRNYLISKNYIQTNQTGTPGSWWIAITAEGLKFINDGGFTGEDKYKNDTLRVATDSRRYAKWALIASIAGILITIVLWLLDKL